jgi:alpha-beta hydrolase superfamily lysophospholipase
MEINKICFNIVLLFTFYSCTGIRNLDKPKLPVDHEGYFYKVADGSRLFVYDYQPIQNYSATIYIISGITGINHMNETDLVQQLSSDENRVVIIHPRGTGFSDGKRGDIEVFPSFINDFIEILSNDRDYISKQHKLFLFGHSMSTAVLLAVADKVKSIDGAILINPPYIQKKAKGMSPNFSQYLQYAGYYLFAKHKPIINMAGDPSKIENEADRNESEKRLKDTLLVKYFSLYAMIESRKLMNAMLDLSRKVNYPLLLIYGMKDNIVDKKGCDLIYNAWKQPNKEYLLIENGTHGKSTVKLATDKIRI